MMKWHSCMETSSYWLFLVAWLIPFSSKYTTTGISPGTLPHSSIQCIDEEREALLQFKQGIEADQSGLLTSWTGQECCDWYGILCNNCSGHVIRLDLRGHEQYPHYLEGTVSPSLVKLKHLKYLDLSLNDFLDQPIPSFVGSLHSLEYLNLSFNGFQGEISHQFANLSSLTSLDLSYNGGLYVKSLGWLFHLTLLRDINLSHVNLSLATDWMQVVSNLPFLRSLQLKVCGLSPSIPSSLVYTNSSTTMRVLNLASNALNVSSILQWVLNLTRISTSLEYLDLSDNRIPGSIPSAFAKMHSLLHLDLSLNELQGPMPSALGNMRSLLYLDLSSNVLEGIVPGSIFEMKPLENLYLSENNFQGIQFSNSPGSLCSLQRLCFRNNKIINEFSSIIQTFSGCANNSLVILNLSNNSFWGSIPNMIGAFSSLEELYLGSNQLNGTISPSLGQVSRLQQLDLSSNSLTGTLSNHHLSNLSRLSHLFLEDNPDLMINISANWVPPFQLNTLTLRSCKLNPYFPKWLFTQAHLSSIDISNTGISDTIPTSFWNSSLSQLNYLNLSNNKIHGMLPNLVPTIVAPNLQTILNFALTVDLSSNRIEGVVPSFLGNATALFLNDNRFSGSIASICPKFEAYVEVLDLSNNLLSGELPDCLQTFKSLEVLRLDNNNFIGKLPPSMGALNKLRYFSMRNNGFNGELRIPPENWTSLLLLDLAHNSFTGHIPIGIGSILHAIRILDLRSNKIFGKLPLGLCQLSDLQVLDLSYNQISGTIPNCICHLQAMTRSASVRYAPILYHSASEAYRDYVISEMIMWKRKEQSFADTLGLVHYMAISDNQLQGHIPCEISCLRGLASLDFARNNLIGSIPPEIGELTSLEFLDLSGNHLSGQIPSSLANLNFLGTLNLSYNNLSGKIPMGTQLQSMDPTAYMGNPGLCGPPLLKCTEDSASTNVPSGQSITQEEENDGSDIYPGLYVSVVLGFIIGFWGVCGTLVIKRSWGHTYFRFVEDMYGALHVMVAVAIARIWRRQ